MLAMLEYLNQYFNIPIVAIIAIVVFLVFANLIGEALEFKGKVVPEFMKIRKYFARKKQERETLAQMPEMMDKVKALLDDVNQHYSSDNIKMRDGWMSNVNESMKKLDKIDSIVLDIQIDNKRNAIIGFVNRAIDMNTPVSEEEFRRIFDLYDEYEKIIEENGLTNGQVDVSYDMIKEAYEERTRAHAFIEHNVSYYVK